MSQSIIPGPFTKIKDIISGAYSSTSNKISSFVQEHNLHWINQIAESSKQFCTDYKQIVIAAAAFSVFYLWTRKDQPKKKQNKKNEVGQQSRSFRSESQFQTIENESKSMSIVNATDNLTNTTKNRIETLTMQRLLESDEDQQQDGLDKYFFEVYKNYLKS